MAANLNTLARVPFLEGLHPDEINALAPHVETFNYDKGDNVFLAGDPGGALLIVSYGTVELFIYDESQNRIVLSQVKGGNFFGEVSLFDHGVRTANAIATEATQVLIIRQAVIVDFLHKHPDAAIHMINVLSKRLRDNTTLLTTNKDRSATAVYEERYNNPWNNFADYASKVVGSWRYLSILIVLIIAWIILNVTQLLGFWDRPFEFNILNLTITILGALQLPLILMSQRQQNEYTQIAADLEFQVSLKAQLAILEVNHKLDWLRESMLDQTARLERLENAPPTLGQAESDDTESVQVLSENRESNTH
ncbi:MAG: DUF1003 domain-containing protein [Chloroflexota bacterium]